MNTNNELIKKLIHNGILKTQLIIEAFKEIDRINFVLEIYKKEAYENYPLPIGFGQTISQPLTVAFM
ncbi:MAG: L-isoaspartyl protein carboxyl methyltransferase, partial [Minisyncoccia bacterium]